MNGKLPFGASSSKTTVDVVGRLRAALRQHAGERGEGVAAGLGIGLVVERRRDILRGHRLAVLELHALADLERPLRGVRVGLPALGEPRHGLELAVREDQVLARLPEDGEGALVVDHDRVEVAARGLEARPEGPAGRDVLLADRGAARGRILLPAAARAREESDQRQRHSDDRATADELPASDVPGAILVDDVVLELAPLRANRIDLSLNLILAQKPQLPSVPSKPAAALSHGRTSVSTQRNLTQTPARTPHAQ